MGEVEIAGRKQFAVTMWMVMFRRSNCRLLSLSYIYRQPFIAVTKLQQLAADSHGR